MTKEKYERTEMEIVKFRIADVITSSPQGLPKDDEETERVY